MRINRRFLYLGVFLVAVGGVLVLTDLGGSDTTTIREALRLWPLAVIAMGVGTVLRRSRYSLGAGLLAAAAPGLLVGGGFALGPRVAADCGTGGTASAVATEQGAFGGPARVSVAAGCASLEIATAEGDGWRFEADHATNRAPIVDASTRSLTIEGGQRGGWRFGGGRDAWRLTLPTTEIADLSVEVNAGEGRIDLPGARIGNLNLTTNAGQTTVDLSAATVASLSTTVNAGVLSIQLPATADLVGSMEANAGGLEVCAPSDLGLRVRHTGALNGISVNGEHQSGADWQSANYTSATHRADLDIEVNLGNVQINPIGGCK